MDAAQQARTERVNTTLDGFITRHNQKYPDDQRDRNEVLKGFNSLYFGDPALDGKFRADAFDIYDRGVNFDQYLKAEVEVEVAKRMATLATEKPAEAKVETIPTLDGGGGPTAPVAPQSTTRFEQALDRARPDVWASLLKGGSA